MTLLDIKLEQFELLKDRKKMMAKLPHLFSYKWYYWAKAFYESRNRINLLCAANQISKSSTQIRKAIHWATCPSMWNTLWPNTTPRQFWYLYPSKDIVNSEFEKKWEPEFMPREDMKTHPSYGWVVKKKQGNINEILFNTGVSIYFKTYTQDVKNLQAGTVHAIFCDEELPIHLFDELMFRLTASEGYYHQVFTATLGQEFWRRALERIGHRDETLKGALKQQISMYDCLKYEDGSTTPWTNSKINRIKNTCKSESEIQRRVYGRFILDKGRKYPCFFRDVNMVKPKNVPVDWGIFTGVDIGSGGKTGHPAAISFVAVRPDFKFACVFRGWRGDNEVTTASDILIKYRLLRGKLKPILQCYDWAAADFFTYASRLGETFTKAEKSHDLGEDILNVLFKNRMLEVFDLDELQGLANELSSLTKEEVKRYAKDDFVDSLRYAVTRIPWDFSSISDELIFQKPKKDRVLSNIEKRRAFVFGEDYAKEEYQRVEDEIEDYNELFAY